METKQKKPRSNKIKPTKGHPKQSNKKEGNFPARSYPVVKLDIELVDGYMGSGHEDLLHERVEPLEYGKVVDLGAVLVEIWHQFPVLRHPHSTRPNPKSRRTLEAIRANVGQEEETRNLHDDDRDRSRFSGGGICRIRVKMTIKINFQYGPNTYYIL